MTDNSSSHLARRRGLVLICFALMGVTLVVRAAYLQIVDQEFYLDQGKARHIRTVAIPANRGDLLDQGVC